MNRNQASNNNTVVIGVVVLAMLCCGAVPVVGILSAIAIPNYLAMQLRAKRAEAPTYVDSIRTAEKAYHAEWDGFTTVAACPPFVPGPLGVDWDSTWPCYQGFSNLGWLPDGLALCQYQVVANNDPNSSAMDDFLVTSSCDIDGDGSYSTYEANRATKATMTSLNNQY
jgi:type II secretory pathway pseudopilin PulG